MVKIIRMLVLIVDDSKDFAAMLKKILHAEGVEADFVTSGRDALEKLNGTEYGILFLDMLMPDMDGVETLEKIRAAGSTIPAIVVTGYGEPGMIERLQQLGVETILKKPVKIEEIVKAIQSAFNKEVKAELKRNYRLKDKI